MNATSANKLILGTDYALRTGGEDDWAFVLDSWRWSHLTSPLVGGASRDIFFEEFTPRIIAALRRSRLKVAHDVASPTTLLGWAVLEGRALHYVLVRRDFRGQGIARALLEGEPISFYSHKPRSFRGAPRDWTFNPWAFTPITKET